MVRRDSVHLEELLLRALPHRWILGFVPYFPIFYAPLEAMRPSFVVVPDDMLADPRPFREVLRRIDVVRLDFPVVLNRHTKPIEDFAPGLDKRLQVRVRKGKVVACRIVLVGVEVREHVRDVYIVRATPRSTGVMRPHKRDSSPAEFVLLPIQPHRSVVNAVKRLYSAALRREVNGNLSAKRNGSRHDNQTRKLHFFICAVLYQKSPIE